MARSKSASCFSESEARNFTASGICELWAAAANKRRCACDTLGMGQHPPPLPLPLPLPLLFMV